MKQFIWPLSIGFVLSILIISCEQHHRVNTVGPRFEQRKADLRRLGYEIISEIRPAPISGGASLTTIKDGQITLWKYRGDFLELTSIESEGKSR